MTAALKQFVTALPKENRERDALIEAYRHLEDFAYAMSEVLKAEREIDEQVAEFGHAEGYWTSKYQEMFGRACVAMQKVPAVWLAIMNVKLAP